MFDILIEGLEIQKIFFFLKHMDIKSQSLKKSVYKSLSALLLSKVKSQTLS